MNQSFTRAHSGKRIPFALRARESFVRDLPREAIPTPWLNEVEVWDALLAADAAHGPGA